MEGSGQDRDEQGEVARGRLKTKRKSDGEVSEITIALSINELQCQYLYNMNTV